MVYLSKIKSFFHGSVKSVALHLTLSVKQQRDNFILFIFLRHFAHIELIILYVVLFLLKSGLIKKKASKSTMDIMFCKECIFAFLSHGFSKGSRFVELICCFCPDMLTAFFILFFPF